MILNKEFKAYRPGFILAMSIFIAAPKVNAMDLQDYVADVVSGHPLVREQVHIFRQAVQEQTIAESGWRPSVDLLASASRVEGDSPVTGGTRLQDYNANSVELSVTQNLFDGFDTTHRIKQTEARMRSALFELYDTADNIALDAIQAYLEVLKQKRLLSLAVENVASHEDTLKKIRQRASSGAGRRSQLEQTEGRIAQAQASLVAQKNNLEDALSAVHELLGRFIKPEELFEPMVPPEPELNLDDLVDQALTNHPALRVASFNIDAALLDQLRSKNTRYPNVDLKLAKEIGDNISGVPGDRDELSLILNLQYNLYHGGADKAGERQKTSAVHEHQQFKARVRRQVINTLRLARVADVSLNEQLVYLKQHVKKTRETSISYQKEFFIGQRDLINLLDVKSELNSAQNRYVEAYFESLAARFRVYEGLGSLFESLGVTANVGEDDLVIAKVAANALDDLPLDMDLDVDHKLDNRDHCDNSLTASSVNNYGCLNNMDNAPLAEVNRQHNNDPIAMNDDFTLQKNGVLVIAPATLLKNDIDSDNDTLGLKTFSQPKHGRLAMNADKHFVYRAADGFTGADSFSYTITDNNQANSTATVTIVIPDEAEISLEEVQYVNFGYDSAALTSSSIPNLTAIVNQLKLQPEATVRVYTYTDNIGSRRFNRRLSNDRAKAIAKLLQEKGIAKNRIKVYGKGEENPIAENDTAEGQAINRRGEFHFDTKKESHLKAYDDEFSMQENGMLLIMPETILSNDTNTSVDNNTLLIKTFNQPKYGKLAMNEDKNFVYRATEGFVGVDRFRYKITDGKKAIATAMVVIDVQPDGEISLDNVHYVNFGYDSTKLTLASKEKLARIVHQLKLQPEVDVRVYTYTDNIGSKDFNRKLSTNRANAVSALLQDKGIAENRIRAFGKGENDPIANNNSKEGQAINRRGEFHFILNSNSPPVTGE